MDQHVQSKVAVIRCTSYDVEEVYGAISAGLDALGGIGEYIGTEERVLVKPNFLTAAEAEKCVTTHPAVIKAVCRILSEAGYTKVGMGDSPGHGTSQHAAQKLGLAEADLYGAKLFEMSEERRVKFPEGRFCKEFYFAKEVTTADAIIGLCKMKTHMLERVTGAVKNMYGLVCGYRKAGGHVNYPTAMKFAGMAADIHRATPQRMHIMDAVTAMEGNGPASGTPVQMNMILISSDPVALDTVFCRLVYLKPELVPTNVQGELAGIGTFHEDRIEVLRIKRQEGLKEYVTEPCTMDELAASWGNPAFHVPREKEKLNILSLWSKLTGGARRPVIDPDKCIRCGMCVEHCPVEGKAVDFTKGRDHAPVYNYRKCIRCYCCQELCPQKAISVK